MIIAIMCIAMCAACTSISTPAIKPASIVVRTNSEFNSAYDLELFMQKGGLVSDSFGHRVTAKSLLQMAASSQGIFRVRISYQGDEETPTSDIKKLHDELLRNAKSEQLVVEFQTPVGEAKR